MVNKKLDRLYKEEIDYVKRNGKGKLRGQPLQIPAFGPVGVRLVSGEQAALATGGQDGGEALRPVVSLAPSVSPGVQRRRRGDFLS